MAPRQSVAPMPTPAILGHLELIARKTGVKLNGFPIDAERVTFGRDEDCDVRIYVPDVSKLHAEIEFDLETGQAALTVHGTNGLVHTPSGGKPTKHHAGAIIALGDGDQLLFAKKLFRFTYGAGSTSSGYDSPTPSPVKLPPVPGSPGPSEVPSTPVRRRASHRLSIVPQGRRFVPLQPRRSTLGLELPVTADEEEEEEPVQLAGDEGDTLFVEKRAEEPKIFENAFMTPQVRRKVEPRNTSVVPRRIRFAEDTKQVEEEEPVEAVEPAVETDVAQPPTPEALEDAEEEPESPRTPRFVPLPQSETTYETPSRAGPQITAQVAYSTPRGDASLRKLLLLRSARKVWEESQLQRGVDGGIAMGSVETRRKSFGRTSSRKSSPPKPVIPDSDSDSSDAENDENEPPTESPAKEGELKWIFEDGQGSFDDSDSDGGSLSSDTSIPGQGVIDFGDLAGQSDGDEGDEVVEEAEDEEDEDEDAEGEEEEQWELSVESSASEADISGDVDDAVPEKTSPGTEPIQLTPPKAPTPQRSPRRGPRVSHTGLSEIGGPAIRFTPAEKARPVSLGVLTPSRRGLGTPVREMGPEDGESLLWSPLRPQPPSQPNFTVTEAQSNTPDFLMDDDDMPSMTPLKATSLFPPSSSLQTSTPKKSRKSMPKTPEGLTPAQREALGTPRRICLPEGSFTKRQPASPSATPVKELHPALLKSPEPEPRGLAPGTPLDDIKRRLSVLALKTATPAKERRKTLDFAVPSTPLGATARKKRLSNIFGAVEELPSPTPEGTVGEDALADAEEEPEKEHLEASPTYSLRRTPRRSIQKPVHSTPKSAAKTPSKTPKSKTPVKEHTGDMYEAATAEADEAEPAVASPKSKTRTKKRPSNAHQLPPMTPDLTGVKHMYAEKTAATPAMTGIREMYSQPKEAETPKLAGIREMYAAPREQATPDLNTKSLYPSLPAATPALSGIKEMYAQPKEAPTPDLTGVKTLYPKLPPATPAMNGIKEMYAAPKTAATPALSGVRELYAQPKEAATPALDGVRHMYAQTEAATPALDGVKHLYPQKNLETPAMDGVKHLYGKQAATPRLAGMKEMFAQKREKAYRASVGDFFPELPERGAEAAAAIPTESARVQHEEPADAEAEQSEAEAEAEADGEVAAEAELEEEHAQEEQPEEPELEQPEAEPEQAAESEDTEEKKQEQKRPPSALSSSTSSSGTARSRLPRKVSAPRVAPTTPAPTSPPKSRSRRAEVDPKPSTSTRTTRAKSKEPEAAKEMPSRRSTRQASAVLSEPPVSTASAASRRSTRSTSTAPEEPVKVVRRTRSRQVLGEAEQPRAASPEPASKPTSRTTRAKPTEEKPSTRRAKTPEVSKPTRSTRTRKEPEPEPVSKPTRSTRRAVAGTKEEPETGIKKPSVRTKKENEAPRGAVAARTRSRK